MSLFVAKRIFSLSGRKKLTGESVCGRVIRSNMRLPYTALQAADRLFSRELGEHAIDCIFSQFSSFVSLPVALSGCLGRKPANVKRWGVATAWTAAVQWKLPRSTCASLRAIQ